MLYLALKALTSSTEPDTRKIPSVCRFLPVTGFYKPCYSLKKMEERGGGRHKGTLS
jgi:hypothetical protein